MNKRTRNPFLVFLPFLLLDIIIVFKFRSFSSAGDGPRYITFAQHLLHGFYSPPPPAIDLWNGPGYPIILMPFVWLKLPLICITLLNALFHYASMVFLYKTTLRISSPRYALLFGLLWAFYLVAYEQLPYVSTEPFVMFLFMLIAYTLVKGVEEKNLRASVLCGLSLGWLALVKVIFGYIIIALLLFYIFRFLIKKGQRFYLRFVFISLLALTVNLPYLIYTYQLTGKLLYWGNSGGMSLYWMSTPFANEFGDWQPPDLNYLLKAPTDTHPFKGADTSNIKYQAFQELVNNHQQDYSEFNSKTGVAKDDAFKHKAVENIKKNPGKFLRNCVSNFGRLIFNVPYTWKFQDPTMLVRILFNSVVFTFILITSLITILRWKKIIPLIKFLIILLLVYLAASLIVSAYSRMFYIVVPVIFVWMAYIFYNFINISFRQTGKLSPE
jgi:Dolichyl-phosphate-mannose-protein mannosyltransferase